MTVVNAYVGFIVRRKDTTAEGTVDAHDADAALVWWGYKRGHKGRKDGQEWVPWSDLEVVNPAGDTITFSAEVRRRQW